jgi:hypothetical protein
MYMHIFTDENNIYLCIFIDQEEEETSSQIIAKELKLHNGREYGVDSGN